MSGQTERHDAAARGTSPELRAQLDELLAAFDEIACFGREQRARTNAAADAEGEAG